MLLCFNVLSVPFELLCTPNYTSTFVPQFHAGRWIKDPHPLPPGPLLCNTRNVLDDCAQRRFAMERSMGALTVLPPAWRQVSVPLSKNSQDITSWVYSALPKIVTWSYGGSPTLNDRVSRV